MMIHFRRDSRARYPRPSIGVLSIAPRMRPLPGGVVSRRARDSSSILIPHHRVSAPLGEATPSVTILWAASHRYGKPHLRRGRSRAWQQENAHENEPDARMPHARQANLVEIGGTRMSHGPVLVTGGAGYVGSVLVDDLLRRGRSVRALDALTVGDGRSLLHLWGRPGFEFVRGDVRDAECEHPRSRASRQSSTWQPSSVTRMRDGILTARARSIPRQPVALVDEAAPRGSPDSSLPPRAATTGRFRTGTPLRPRSGSSGPCRSTPRPRWPPSSTCSLDSTSGFATTCLRFATVYGVSPRMRFDLTVNEFARDAFVNRELVVYGEQFWRPYVHVWDAVQAVSAVLEAPAETGSRRGLQRRKLEPELPQAGSRRASCSSGFPTRVVERVAQGRGPAGLSGRIRQDRVDASAMRPRARSQEASTS